MSSYYAGLNKGGENGILVSGVIVGYAGWPNSDLVIDGGTTTLTNANTYYGPTFIRNGATLNANAANAIPTTYGRTDVTLDDTGSGGSTLALGVSQKVASITGAASSMINLNNNNILVGTTSGSSTFAGAISGSGGSLTKDGNSTIVLSGTNTYTGATTITGGTLSVGQTANLGDAASNLILNGGTLQITGTTLTSFSGIGHAVSFTNGKVVSLDINNAGNIFTADQVLNQGTGGLTKTGAGTLALNQTNTYTGATTVNEGILQAGAAAGGQAFGNLSRVTIYNGATLNLNGFNQTIGSLAGGGATGGNVTLGTDAILTTGGNNTDTTFQGVISGTGTSGLIKVGTGTMVLTGVNTYTGATTISGGTLISVKGDALGSTSTVAVNAGATLVVNYGGVSNYTQGQAASLLAKTSFSDATATFAFDTSNAIGGQATYGDVLSMTGGGGLAKLGSGILTLTGSNNYTGATTVKGGVLVADTANNGTVLNSASALVVGGGTFQIKGVSGAVRSQILNGLTINSGANVVDVNNLGTSTTLDLRGTSGDQGITRTAGTTVDFKATTGTLGTNAIIKTARTNDASGILGAWASVNGGAAFAANNGSDVIVAYTGYTNISAKGSYLADGTVTNVRINSAGSTGNVQLVAVETNINTLTQNSTTASTVDTAEKILRVGTTGGIFITPTGANLTIGTSAASGILTAGGDASDAAGELILMNNSSNALTINSNVANNGTGVVAVTKSGTGSTTLTGTNTYTGATTVNSGTLVVDGSIASSSGVSLAAGTTLGGHGFVSTITGAGTVAPGNSPGILTAVSVDPILVDPIRGMGFAFQFTKTGSPIYNPLFPSTNSGNDVLHLTGGTPFASALTGINDVLLDFSGYGVLTVGEVFKGGFYTNNGSASSLYNSILNANFTYVGLSGGQSVVMSTVAEPADFGSGIVNGYVTEFSVVPEPSRAMLLMVGLGSMLMRRRRR